MIKNKTLVQELSPEQLSKLLAGDVSALISAKFNEFAQKQSREDLLSREQACEFLQINFSTLNRWTKDGKIPVFGIGNRRYFKREDIMNALIQFKK